MQSPCISGRGTRDPRLYSKAFQLVGLLRAGPSDAQAGDAPLLSDLPAPVTFGSQSCSGVDQAIACGQDLSDEAETGMGRYSAVLAVVSAIGLSYHTLSAQTPARQNTGTDLVN